LRERAVLGEERAVASLIDADNDGAPRGLAPPRLEQEIGGGHLRRTEDVRARNEDQGEGHGKRERRRHHGP
jgi:hypothetical protein